MRGNELRHFFALVRLRPLARRAVRYYDFLISRRGRVHPAETRDMLDSRYDDLKTGRVKPIDGEQFFERPSPA